MPVYEREVEVEEGEATVTIEIEEDTDHVTVDAWNRETVVVDVDEDVAIIDEPIPDWAEQPLADIGVRTYEYRE